MWTPFSNSPRPSVIAACLLLGIFQHSAAAQSSLTDSDRALAAELIKLPDADARARIAAMDAPLLTAGLSSAVRQSVRDMLNRHENPAEGVRVLTLAISIAQRGGFTLDEAEAWFGIGGPYLTMGRIEDALDAYNRAEPLYRLANAPPQRVAGVYTNRANANRHAGNYPAALDDNRAAEKIDRELNDEVGLARVLNNTGLLYQDMGDYRGAVRVLQQSLEIAQRRGERAGEAYVLNNLASAATLSADYGPAATYAQKSLEIKEALANKQDVVSSLINLGNIYHHAGRIADAQKNLRRAIDLAVATSQPAMKAEALDQMGLLEFDLHQYDAALADVEEARKLYHDAGEKEYEAATAADLARILLSRNENARALELANAARNQARDAGAIPDVLPPSVVAGQALRRLHRDAEARAAFEEAISVLEQMRYLIAGGAFERESFLAERSAPYREMAALDAHQGHWASALAMSERAKGRVLLDLLSGGAEQSGRFMNAAERSRESQLRARLAQYGTQYRLISAEPQAPPAKLAELRALMDKTRTELDEFRLAFYAAHPELGVRGGEVQPIDWRAASTLPNAKTAILDFASTPDGVYLFVIAQGRPLSAHRIALSHSALSKQVKDFREKLATRDPGFPAASEALFATLIGPAISEIAGKTELIITPDADLWQVPFQALRAHGGHYLIEDAAISYAPSLSVLSALRKSRKRPSETNSLGAFGNPTNDAAESEQEVKKLAALYAPGGRAWIGAEATEDNFRQRAPGFDIIHVAAHGVFDDVNPLRSKIVFHPPVTKNAEDGWLEADEIRALELHASLVVLSGCETARGNFEDGEGAVGMAWAFLAAGGHAVVASQWRVESSSTTELMLKFHTALRAGVNKADALRQAALELMRDPHFRHPFYWAGFQLIGDGN